MGCDETGDGTKDKPLKTILQVSLPELSSDQIIELVFILFLSLNIISYDNTKW